uniref:Lysosome membrane protein 2 n=1 Tax=Strigamia maritima TaxID=126957 RepID=T1JNU7_STRMM
MGLNVTARLGIAGTVGAVLFALGAVLYVVFPDIIAGEIKEVKRGILSGNTLKNMKIVNGSLTYQAWEKAPIPIYMHFTFFNVTNSADYVANRSKPIVEEIGPYVFREYRQKVNISFSDEEDTVDYEQIKWFTFEPERSKGNLSDMLTTLNVPFTSLALKTEGKLTLMQQMMLPNIIKMYKAEPFITKTVEEFLYKGYQDQLMIFLAKQSKKEILPNGTFGFQYGQNYTADGVYTVFTGVKDPNKFMQIYKWNNVTSLYLTFEREAMVQGIKTYRFTPPFSVTASADLNEDNKCFCPVDKDCLLSGALAVSSCKKDAPIVLTGPHFYQADDRYADALIGLNRDKKLHETILDIEPVI